MNDISLIVISLARGFSIKYLRSNSKVKYRSENTAIYFTSLDQYINLANNNIIADFKQYSATLEPMKEYAEVYQEVYGEYGEYGAIRFFT